MSINSIEVEEAVASLLFLYINQHWKHIKPNGSGRSGQQQMRGTFA